MVRALSTRASSQGCSTWILCLNLGNPPQAIAGVATRRLQPKGPMVLVLPENICMHGLVPAQLSQPEAMSLVWVALHDA